MILHDSRMHNFNYDFAKFTAELGVTCCFAFIVLQFSCIVKCLDGLYGLLNSIVLYIEWMEAVFEMIYWWQWVVINPYWLWLDWTNAHNRDVPKFQNAFDRMEDASVEPKIS